MNRVYTDTLIGMIVQIVVIEVYMRSQRTYTQYIENEGTVLTFGKHRGETVRQVLRNDPGYILWLYEAHVASLPNDIVFKAEDAVADMDKSWSHGPHHNYSSYYDD